MSKFELFARIVILSVAGGVLAFIAGEGHAQPLPPNAVKYLPMLHEQQKLAWPDMAQPEVLAAQTHKETCITVKHSKCWNPRAELKTQREYGFGMGQLTIAYHANGTERFNVFKEVQALDPELRKWTWENRFDPRMQLRAQIVKNRVGYLRVSGAATPLDHIAFSLAQYNGGAGGLLSDRRICKATPKCDPARWFGHVENTSNKSRKPWKGYGKSAFEINRAYPKTILFDLAPLYKPFFAKGTK